MRFRVHLVAMDDTSLTATVEVEATSVDLAGEVALDEEWNNGADWSNGQRRPATGGVLVTSVKLIEKVS
jgi:hypothetical protein